MPAPEMLTPAMSEHLPILYQDAHLVAVHKPAGLLVHRTGIDRHETRFAVQIVRDQIHQHVFPVHRLDKGTSGVLLFALNQQIARELTQHFTEQKIDKRYWAVVRGHPPEQGRIDHPLDRILDDYGNRRDSEQLAGSSVESQPAITEFRRLASIELPVAIDRYPCSRYALLELAPLTGRRHQIRRHLKHLAHPIIGDVRYGKGNHNRYFRDALQAPRLLLACVRMQFDHPVSAQPLCIEQAVDGCFQHLLQQWAWPTSPT